MGFSNDRVFEPLFGRKTEQSKKPDKEPEKKPGEDKSSQATFDAKQKPKVAQSPAQNRKPAAPFPQAPRPRNIHPARSYIPRQAKRNPPVLAGLEGLSKSKLLWLLILVIVVLAIAAYFYYNSNKKSSKFIKRMDRELGILKNMQRKRSRMRRDR